MTVLDAGVKNEAEETWLARTWSEFAENRVAVVALGVVVALIGIAILAPFVTPQNPYDLTQLNIMDNMLPPGARSMDGKLYLLGTDDQGRDLTSSMACA